MAIRLSRSVARGGQWDAPPVNGTGSLSAKGWDQGGILAPAAGLQGAWCFPLNSPQGLLHPGRGSQPQGSRAGRVGLGTGGGLEQAKTPGCPLAKGYKTPPKE